MAEDYNYTNFKEQDLKEITELFSSSYGGRVLDSEYYTWRVLNTPIKKKLVNLCKNNEGKIISHYAVCPTQSYFRGESFESVLSLITMTHPSYKFLGLFPKLAENLYNRSFETENIQMVYGFPNTNSHYNLLKKLKWNDVYMVPTMKKNITASADVKSEAIEVYTADDHFDVLWEKHVAASSLFYPNKRTSKFINWRFFERPDKKYRLFTFKNNSEIIGYFVVKEYTTSSSVRDLDVVDFIVLPDLNPVDFYNSIVALAKSEGFNSINMWIPYSSDLFHAAEKQGFLPKEHITYLGFRPFNPQRNMNDLLIPRNWYMTMCDSDVY